MFTERTIDLPTGPLHYQAGGSGPPILHLHPAGGPRVSPVIERLAGRRTVFMPTDPGFNGTPRHAAVTSISGLAELMAEFVRTVIRGPCNVMAELFGGWIALWLAAKHPDLVKKLVLQAPAGLRDEGTGGLPADPEGRLRALYSRPEHAPKETRAPAVIAELQRMREVYANGINYDAALHRALPGIKARTLILIGTNDTVVPVITAHRLKAGIADAQLSFIDGAAHALEFDAPAQVWPLVDEFLEDEGRRPVA